MEKAVTMIVKNNGQAELTNISLEITGLESSEYQISPQRIESLSPGKEEMFTITFTIKGQSEKPFKYLIKSDQIEKEEIGLITVLNLKDFLSREVLRLKSIINALVVDEESKGLLEECSQMIEKAEEDISALQLVIARQKLIETEVCIEKFKIEYAKSQSQSWLSDYRFWIMVLLIILVIILISIVVYLAYVRISLVSFLQNQKSLEEAKKPAANKSELDKKIEEIRRTLSEE
jgi:hypothetical protein